MANTKINKSDLGYLGPKTQKQIVKLMIENPKWLSIYLDCIKKDKPLFTLPQLGDIIDYTKKTFEERGTCPSYREIFTSLKVNKCKTDEDCETLKNLLTELKSEELLQDIEIGETTGMDALKRAETLYVLDNARSTIDNMQGFNETVITELMEKVSKIMKVSSSKIEDTSVDGLVSSLCEEKPTEKVPVGNDILDKQLNGGIPKGQLALLIAGTGVGKTTLSSIFCNGAAMSGYKVMQIFFEDSKEDIARKHFAHLTNELTSNLYEDNARRIINNLYAEDNRFKNAMENNIRLVRMENGETTVETIKNYINNLINTQGWKPDMIFIDYLSCLLPTENKVLATQYEWQAWERCMKKLESLAQELNIVIWVAQQTNRNGMLSNTANERMANIQGSFRATQPCSFVLYLDKTNIEEGDFNKANLYLDKCRGCMPKDWKGIYLNNGTCQLDLSEVIMSNDDLEFDNNYQAHLGNNK